MRSDDLMRSYVLVEFRGGPNDGETLVVARGGSELEHQVFTPIQGGFVLSDDVEPTPVSRYEQRSLAVLRLSTELIEQLGAQGVAEFVRAKAVPSIYEYVRE